MRKETNIEKDFIKYISDAYPTIIIRNNIRNDQVNQLRQAFFSGAFCQMMDMESLLMSERGEEKLLNYFDDFKNFFTLYIKTRIDGGDYKIGETE